MNTDSSGPENQNQSYDGDKQNLVLLLAKFEIEFPSQDACLAELFRLAQIERRCRVCFSGDLEMSPGGRVGKCTACKRKTWLTAGTILDHMRVPRARLAAIWLTRKGAILNSVAFGKLFAIAQSSAHAILEWVRFTIQNLLPPDAPLVHSSLFTAVFWKRSLETPARERPVAEQDEMERMAAADENPIRAPESQEVSNDSTDLPLDLTCIDLVSDEQSKENSNFNGDDTRSDAFFNMQEQVYELLSETPLHFDALFERAEIPVGTLSGCLTMLELEGKAERLVGDWYVRRKPKPRKSKPAQEMIATVEAFIDFIRVNFRGISRKYLQSYLAAFWCHTDRSHWSSDAIWQTCLGSRPVSYRQTRQYVTPVWVTLLPEN